MMDMLSLAINPVMGIANIASRTKTGLSLARKSNGCNGNRKRARWKNRRLWS
jgi:hypothetical protein